MSSNQPAKPNATGSATQVDVLTIDPPVDRKSRWRLLIALALGLTWLTGLAVLAWSTANPITLNQDQIQRSTRIVIGRLSDEQNSFVVEDEWIANERFQSPVIVTNLEDTRLQPGERYIVPLQRDAARTAQRDESAWEVTPSLLPTREPLVYPATDEALKQLESIRTQ